MTINFNGLEVTISAKYSNEDRKNKAALLDFLNEISFMYSEAAEGSKARFGNSTASLQADWNKKGDMLYNICKENGAYNN